MYISQIKIIGVSGIHELELKFNKKVNILCGPNGIGKTSILESIAHLFVISIFGSKVIKRNVIYDEAIIEANLDIEGSIVRQKINFNVFQPNLDAKCRGITDKIDSSYLISIKATRNFTYEELKSVSKDTPQEQFELSNLAAIGIKFQNIKQWFVNRYLYSAHKGSLTEEQIENFELAKHCLSIIDPNISFSRVAASDNEILINTPSGEIYFEYLSSGFKSVFIITLGIIKEIEFRFMDRRIVAKDFEGVILIDEIELHLHPEWQEKIISILTETFPKAQFFVTTHSPHVIQCSDPEQIIALGYNEENKVFQRDIPNTKYGFKGWTIEEVLSDVMGMKSLRTDLFTSLIEEFGKAIDDENVKDAESIYQQIDDMLHPQNELRKLLKFQLIGIK
ncbi:AAA family ATPase [Elizabethkingia anophelis]|uniref:AAA family ATPase n=1 Tax=Elizabethkingia anophelis TaxID=1117645 RepID=UPI001EE71CC6|nr:AAA family ATPase [Elizabethkingia anophelis]UKY87391.1 AAA family ATPase [Elizabethkingia anophelis]UKZ01501.1 AAA family ATPase [Elizabethkingia anophelis]